MDDYADLVNAMKALTQGEGSATVTLPMAEDEWETRPDTSSYGTIRLDFEVDPLNGDDRKVSRAYEGSVDLFSRNRNGDGSRRRWPPTVIRPGCSTSAPTRTTLACFTGNGVFRSRGDVTWPGR